MSEEQRAAGQTASTAHVDGGATDTDRDTVAREIGAQLVRARESHRLSIEDVSARLKVAATKLAAIESGNLQALPDITFAKGVMRAYARMLQVDIDALLGRLHPRLAQVAEITRRQESGINQTFDDRRRFRSSGGTGGRWVWLTLVVAGLAAGGYFGFDHLKAWLEARNSNVAAVAADEPAQQGSDGTVTAALPPVMAASDAPAPSEAPAASASPVATVAPEAVVPAAATVTAVSSAPVAAASASAPSAVPVVAGSGELQIRFSADTWYEIRDRNGKVVMGGIAKAGQEVAGGGVAPYKVVIGNVKGVESMSRSGAPVDLQAANRNNVARLTLP